jgi:hypothetical protein
MRILLKKANIGSCLGVEFKYGKKNKMKVNLFIRIDINIYYLSS